MITLRNLERSYPAGAGSVWVLRQVNLAIAAGEFVTIMGPSGAGKSTLLSILGMLDPGFVGEYHLLDQPVHRLKAKDRAALSKKSIGFVFQQYHLLDDLTVADRFRIVGKKDLYPNQLSGGQQQLVGIARAVIASPKLILADEPTGNLHSEQGREIMALFQKLNRAGTTIIQVTHSEENALAGSRIVRLKDGWVVGDDAVAGR
jgi:ABC-type lipoprotein export system ATPase subunit